uniref:RNase H type-1 domain-containing protein n=1 Tax=Medicago truncatula TaxID=3880 RepID=B7FKK3_MEDTR|nr:unknown [Medicago truncatula]
MGLQLAQTLNIVDVVCYSDSLHYVNLINGPSVVYHAYATLIQDIKDLIRLSKLHTLREGNRCADFLRSWELP